MPFFQPAVRVHHLALDVHVGRGLKPQLSSPGAGRDKPHMYYNNEFDPYHDGPSILTTSTPVPTNVVADLQASNMGDMPTPSTESSTSMITLLSGSVLPASSDIILSSSSSNVQLDSPKPVSGSTTGPVRGGETSAVPAESALAGTGEANSSGRPSGGVIAAIVIALLLAMGAVAFFVFRRYRIQRRVARRATWTTNLAPHSFDDSLEKGVDHGPAVSSDTQIETASQLSKEGVGNGQEKTPPAVRNIARKPPLPYSPVSPIAPSPSQSQFSIPNVGTRAPSMDSANGSTVPSTPLPEVPALVRMTFVPQLPDELAITPGEMLYIRSQFDDGWAMCANSRGEQGMVPLECLEGGGGQFAGRSHLRTTRRASSLSSPTA
ncbi:hypothetical protein BGY98DRAFT_955770 [Russula aff. rugulosa BPL654]|nr:hypothetical protein BGY98DRAFT_955770 [Russula aff. rugulosa BPL654]